VVQYPFVICCSVACASVRSSAASCAWVIWLSVRVVPAKGGDPADSLVHVRPSPPAGDARR
jgi:hypothetical protein